MSDIFLLSEADRNKLRKLLDDFARTGKPNRSVSVQDVSPERGAYVALTPGSGIPALTDVADGENTGTGGAGTSGTGSSSFDRPGWAECSLWRIVASGPQNRTFDLLPLPVHLQIVLNLSSTAVDGNKWILIEQDKFGFWFAVGGAAASGSGCVDLDTIGGEALLSVNRGTPTFSGSGAGTGTDGASNSCCTWTCPPCVTSIVVEIFAEGGDGGGNGVGTGNFGGGGGGAYARSKLTVIPGTVYKYWRVPGGSQPLLAFGFSFDYPNGRINAEGGQIGQSAFIGGDGGDAAASTGDFVFSGGDGGNAYYPGGVPFHQGGGGGGGAGPEENGSAGGVGTDSSNIGGLYASGGAGYGAGGHGAVVMPVNPFTQPYTAQDGFFPGGGGGGAGGYGDMIAGKGGMDQCRITWGRGVTAINGVTDSVSFIGSPHQVSVTPNGQSFTIGLVQQTEIDSHYGTIITHTWESTIVIDASICDKHSITLGGNTTIVVANDMNGQILLIEIVQDAGASGYTVTWPTTTKWSNGTPPVLSPGANDIDVFNLMRRSSGNYYGFTAGQTFA